MLATGACGVQCRAGELTLLVAATCQRIDLDGLRGVKPPEVDRAVAEHHHRGRLQCFAFIQLEEVRAGASDHTVIRVCR